MPYYALYYYQRATRLRPKDARMWCAMGQCYESEQLQMTVAAIRCYQRAVTWNDREAGGVENNHSADVQSMNRGVVENKHWTVVD